MEDNGEEDSRRCVDELGTLSPPVSHTRIRYVEKGSENGDPFLLLLLLLHSPKCSCGGILASSFPFLGGSSISVVCLSASCRSLLRWGMEGEHEGWRAHCHTVGIALAITVPSTPPDTKNKKNEDHGCRFVGSASSSLRFLFSSGGAAASTALFASAFGKGPSDHKRHAAPNITRRTPFPPCWPGVCHSSVAEERGSVAWRCG